MIRLLSIEDYEEIYQMWKNVPGIGLRNMDDSKEGITKLLKRNPNTCFACVEDGRIVGTALSGHDGRRGFLYHVCVEEKYRQKSIGRLLIESVIDAMKAEEITRLALFCKSDNELGNNFWSGLGWTKRTDINTYSYSLNDEE